jgi:L-ascorbate metabolism protein UlaG (beta-lactamase superfamily)
MIAGCSQHVTGTQRPNLLNGQSQNPCLFLLAAAWVLLATGSAGRASAASLVENLNRGTHHDSIQQAIDSATDGDVLVAASGSYNESIHFGGKAITLRSQDPNDPGAVAATVIDGDTDGVSFIQGEGSRSVLAGFVITGATRGILCRAAAPTLFNCRITGNTDAGVCVVSESPEDCRPLLVNCIIAGNGGAGIEMATTYITGRPIEFDFAEVDHCTIVGNRGWGIDGAPTVTNSILWDNNPDGVRSQINGQAVVTYSNVQGGYEGEGNIDELPRFVEPGQWSNPRTPEAAWVRGNYHVFADSPCVDAGDPAFVPTVLTTDIDGHARILGSRTDIGCDEVPQPIYVTWLGHASVRIAWKDLVVYVDPYRLTTSPQDADLILITHSHSDHYSPSDIARVRTGQTQFVAPPDVVKALGAGRSLAPGESIEILDLTIDGVASYNITKTNHPKANNWLGFVIEFGSTRIYCAGDTDLTPEMKALTDIDLAFLPAGGTYTMDATEAAQATKFIQPTLAIPYHWGTATGSIADAEQFARLAACNVKVMTSGQTITSEDWSRDFTFVAHWTLDESQGLIASDSAGDYDATLVGGPLWQPMAGRLNGALQLDGVDDCITTPFVLNPSQATFSIFAWVKGGAPGQTIVSHIGGVNWLLADASTGALATQLKMSGRGSKDLVSTTTVTDGQWRRVGLTWDGSARILYVDDVEVARDAQSSLPSVTTGLRLGGGPNAEANAFWSGWIDDVRIYTRVVVP